MLALADARKHAIMSDHLSPRAFGIELGIADRLKYPARSISRGCIGRASGQKEWTAQSCEFQ